MVDEEKVKAEIIDVARGLIQQFGIKKVTMQDIAKASGKGKSTLYYYFKNKEEILDAVVEEEMGDFFLTFKVAVEKEKEFQSKMRAYVNTKIQSLEQKVHNYRFLIDNDIHYFDFKNYFKKMRFLYDDKEVALIQSILKSGVSAGLVASKYTEGKQGQMTAKMLLIAIRGLEMEVFIQKKFEEVEQKTNLLIELLINGLH